MYKTIIESSVRQLQAEKISKDKMSSIVTQTTQKIASLQREAFLGVVKQVLQEWDGSYLNSEAVYQEIVATLNSK